VIRNTVDDVKFIIATMVFSVIVVWYSTKRVTDNEWLRQSKLQKQDTIIRTIQGMKN
jgi:hypothetical protein